MAVKRIPSAEPESIDFDDLEDTSATLAGEELDTPVDPDSDLDENSFRLDDDEIGGGPIVVDGSPSHASPEEIERMRHYQMDAEKSEAENIRSEKPQPTLRDQTAPENQAIPPSNSASDEPPVSPVGQESEGPAPNPIAKRIEEQMSGANREVSVPNLSSTSVSKSSEPPMTGFAGEPASPATSEHPVPDSNSGHIENQKPKQSGEESLNPYTRFMIWLSGADKNRLGKCPKWEIRKYEAFGATVLVPSIFGAIAASYAVSTVTPPGYGWIAFAFAIVWGWIILTIDRALLSSYRALADTTTKILQFVLRFSVAVLMGFCIAHPLTLLLFKDTITAEIDKQRDAEIEEVRASFAENKANLQTRIATANETYQNFDQQRQQALSAPFEEATADRGPDPSENVSLAKQAMEEQVEQATKAKRAQLTNLDTQLEKHNAELSKIREEYSKWQEEYDNEISGKRGGPAGIGPRARSIEADQLGWRRTETARLTELVTNLPKQRTQLSDEILAAEQDIRTRYAATAAAEADAIREDEMEIASLQRKLQSQRLSIFQNQQEELAAQYKAQMDSAKEERDRLLQEDAQLADLQSERIEQISKGTRQDLLTQTLVLHHLFGKGDEGGQFAMIVYIMIAALFMLLDTIPLVIKFFTKASVYDRLVWEEDELADVPADEITALRVEHALEKYREDLAVETAKRQLRAQKKLKRLHKTYGTKNGKKDDEWEAVVETIQSGNIVNRLKREEKEPLKIAQTSPSLQHLEAGIIEKSEDPEEATSVGDSNDVNELNGSDVVDPAGSTENGDGQNETSDKVNGSSTTEIPDYTFGSEIPEPGKQNPKPNLES